MLKFADLFAGGGGTTSGALNVPNLYVSWALNHDPVAIATHAAAHPETKHYQADIRTQDVNVLEPVDILWASLECTEHSKAKANIYTLNSWFENPWVYAITFKVVSTF